MDKELKGQYVRVLNTYGVLFDDVGVFDGVLSPAQVDGLLSSLPFSSQRTVEGLLSFSRFFNDPAFSSVFKPEHVLFFSQAGFVSPVSMLNAFETILVNSDGLSSSDVSGVLANAVLSFDVSKDPLVELKAVLGDFVRRSAGDVAGSSFLDVEPSVALVQFLGGERARVLRGLVESIPGSSGRHFNIFLGLLNVSNLEVSLPSSFERFMLWSVLRSFSKRDGVYGAVSDAFLPNVSLDGGGLSLDRVLDPLRRVSNDPSEFLSYEHDTNFDMYHDSGFGSVYKYRYADSSLGLVNGVSDFEGNVGFLALSSASSPGFAKFFSSVFDAGDTSSFALAWACVDGGFDRESLYGSVVSFVEFMRSSVGVGLVSSGAFSERELVLAFKSRVLEPVNVFVDDFYLKTGRSGGGLDLPDRKLFDGFVNALGDLDVTNVGSRGFVRGKFELLTGARAPLFGDVEDRLYGSFDFKRSLDEVSLSLEGFTARFFDKFRVLSDDLAVQLERSKVVSSELRDVVGLLEGFREDFGRVVDGLSVSGAVVKDPSPGVLAGGRLGGVSEPVVSGGEAVVSSVGVPVPLGSVGDVDERVGFWVEQLEDFKDEYGQMVVDCQGVDSFEGKVEAVLRMLPVLDGSSVAGRDLRCKLVLLEDLQGRVEAQRRLLLEASSPVESASRFSRLSRTLVLFESAGLALLEHWALVKNLLVNCDLSALSASSGLLASGVPEVAGRVELLRKQVALASGSDGPEGFLAQARASALLSQILDGLKANDPVVVTGLGVYDSLRLELESGVSVRVSAGSQGLSR